MVSLELPIVPPPGLEQINDCMPLPPPGNFETSRPLPPPPVYKAPSSMPPAYPAPTNIATTDSVQEAIWRECEECLRIQCVQNNWAFPGLVPVNSTEAHLGPPIDMNTLVPLKPPGILLRTNIPDANATAPQKMLQRVSSSESL